MSLVKGWVLTKIELGLSPWWRKKWFEPSIGICDWTVEEDELEFVDIGSIKMFGFQKKNQERYQQTVGRGEKMIEGEKMWLKVIRKSEWRWENIFEGEKICGRFALIPFQKTKNRKFYWWLLKNGITDIAFKVQI